MNYIISYHIILSKEPDGTEKKKKKKRIEEGIGTGTGLLFDSTRLYDYVSRKTFYRRIGKIYSDETIIDDSDNHNDIGNEGKTKRGPDFDFWK